MLLLKQITKICVIGLLLSGCSGMFAPLSTPEIHNYQIVVADDNTEVTNCSNIRHGKTLQITRMRAEAPYEATKMFYVSGRYHLDSYSYNQWTAFPTQMISPAILQKVTQACIYKNVVSGEFMTVSDYTLNTKLLELKQIIDGDNSYVSLIVFAQLVDNKPDSVIKTKTFAIKVASSPNPQGYVTGVNQAVSEFLSKLVQWL